MRTGKSILVTTLIVIITLSILAGCNFKENNNTSVKQEIIYNLGTGPQTFDPGLCSDTKSSIVLKNSFVGLCELDENEKPIEGDAKSFEISPDGLTYTFHLRKNLKWSNGDKLKASDYEYAWKRVLDPTTKSQNANQLMCIDGAKEYNSGKGIAEDVGIKAIDDTTLIVTLTTPTPYFLELTTQALCYPVNKRIVENNPDWASSVKTIVSNGPFKITDYKSEDRIVLEKNKNYYDEASVKLEKLTIKLVSEETSAWASYKSGQFDVTDIVPKSDVQSALKDGTAKAFPNLSTYFILINVSDKSKNLNLDVNKVLSDVRVRKALNLAINRQVIVDNVTKAGEVPAHGIVPKGIIDTQGNDFADKTIYFNPEGNINEAKRLLAEAGFENGQGFPTLKLLYNKEGGHGEIMQAVQVMWEKIGVNVELQSQEWKTFSERRVLKNYEVARGGWSADYVDPMTFLDLFISTSTQNYTGYNNPKYEDIINKAKHELDTEKRMELLHEAEDIIMTDMPIIPLYYYTNTIGIKDYVKGIRVSLMNCIYFKNAYIEDKV